MNLNLRIKRPFHSSPVKTCGICNIGDGETLCTNTFKCFFNPCITFSRATAILLGFSLAIWLWYYYAQNLIRWRQNMLIYKHLIRRKYPIETSNFGLRGLNGDHLAIPVSLHPLNLDVEMFSHGWHCTFGKAIVKIQNRAKLRIFTENFRG